MNIYNPRISGTTLMLHSGRAINLCDPQPESICIEDIAHALSQICRFGGHTPRFYSVAEHCILTAQWSPHGSKLTALLHDAAEAYLGDIPSPLKQDIFTQYFALEEKIMELLPKALEIPEWKDEDLLLTKEVDARMLVTEAIELRMKPQLWNMPWPWPEPLPLKLFCWSPEEAENRFLDYYLMLLQH